MSTPEALAAAIARRDDLRKRQDKATHMWLIASLGRQIEAVEAEIVGLRAELAKGEAP